MTVINRLRQSIYIVLKSNWLVTQVEVLTIENGEAEILFAPLIESNGRYHIHPQTW